MRPATRAVQDRSRPLPPIIHHEAYEVDIGLHVFPTAKYRLVKARLLEDGSIATEDIVRPEPATDEEILFVHTPRWVKKLSSGRLSPLDELRLELPFTPALRDAAWLTCGGAILTARLALERGVAIHLGGGYHHAFPGHGEGFCPLNDVAVAIRTLQRALELDTAVVIDLDVHHGNGTAAIFDGDPGVFTLSMHQDNNYPFPKPPSDLDIGLRDGTGDEEYLTLLSDHLPGVLDGFRPSLAYYLAGADPYREDQLGGLGLSIEGLRTRDEYVLQQLTAREVPVAVCLAGGYAVHTDDTITIHRGTVEAALSAAH